MAWWRPPDRLVLALVEANRPLGLRAVATAQGLREDTLRQVQALSEEGDKWQERQKVYERLLELIDDPVRVLSLVDQLRQRTRNGNDLYFLEQAAVAVGAKWPDAGRAAAELQQRSTTTSRCCPRSCFKGSRRRSTAASSCGASTCPGPANVWRPWQSECPP